MGLPDIASGAIFPIDHLQSVNTEEWGKSVQINFFRTTLFYSRNAENKKSTPLPGSFFHSP